ncbi:FAD-binding oxidoreductase [Agrobacterium tumefaciens]|uniref:NAD(P)/FAD-dependent oxidoreductase n=1 Tax=Agrobacterium tumefaciens TaxID=358 RepID=UPI000DD942D0|nr:FAD-binding oxidoreductase [Agrobacterium tumefaciens]KAA1234451.1 FAD-binding oxidoreductase [Agrobacterium tumefaciens]MBP2570402.1 YD repeat-containing protein [Agrobacterium tumefaciens]QNP81208.1 FAD-binding oxidoreductase [Agrobacterium tumefaciens]UXU00558.1 FAD-binding oxidoreductase [Agrobacterium tumefaciens]
MASFSPFDVTLWYATAASAPVTEPLSGRIKADICIVGAGYSGLTTALELARAGVDVVLLERQEIGFGGSGRNAGHCTPTFTHYSLPELRKMLGEPWAERLIERQTRANDRVSQMIRDYQIDCEWVQRGYVMGAPHEGAMEELKRKVETYNQVGARTRLLDRDEVAAVTGSPRFHGGWLHEEAGHLNPLGYARGLGRAVLQEGGRIFTGSGVAGCEREAGGGWKVTTEYGEVVASKVIFTTGAYTVGGWPKLDRTFKIQRVFVAASQILSADTRLSVLPQNTTIHDGRGDIYVYKYNAEGRIVASMFPMGRRGRDMIYTKQVMSERLKWLHPQITEDIRWDYVWFGELDMQYRTVPRFYDLAPGVVALTGLSGRGVPTGSMLGSILSEWALGKPENGLALKLEPLKSAPFYMNFAPALTLRYYRLRDNIATRLAGRELPPHA